MGMAQHSCITSNQKVGMEEGRNIHSLPEPIFPIPDSRGPKQGSGKDLLGSESFVHWKP